jgi:hypothetical protein
VKHIYTTELTGMGKMYYRGQVVIDKSVAIKMFFYKANSHIVRVFFVLIKYRFKLRGIIFCNFHNLLQLKGWSKNLFMNKITSLIIPQLEPMFLICSLKQSTRNDDTMMNGLQEQESKKEDY